MRLLAPTIEGMSPLRVAAAQFDSTVGAIDANSVAIRAMIMRAREEHVDLVIFPELSVTGYPPEDLLLRPDFVERNLGALAEIAGEVHDIVAVVGFVDRGMDLYNAAAVLADGRVRMKYYKQILPNYTVFDECRYFRPGTTPAAPFEVNGVRVGIAVCEDAWSPTGAVAQAGAQGCDLVAVLNSSPFSMGRQQERERIMSVRASDASVDLIYVNQVGAQDELIFDGGSFYVAAAGDVRERAPRFVQDLMIVEVSGVGGRFRKRLVDPRGSDLATKGDLICQFSVARKEVPLVSPRVEVPAIDPSEVLSALTLALSDYVRKNNFPGVLVAVSGGIDSALVAALAVDACGGDRVELVGLPSRYSSQGSLDDGEALARSLGAHWRVIPIEEAHSVLAQSVVKGGSAVEGLTDENLQSRIRGLVMMAISNQSGKLVVATGNKSELAVGYSTLYGDTAGGYSLIKDLYKSHVYALCRYLNEVVGRERIPQAILDKPPSAELRPEQLDSDSLPDYDTLDKILYLLVDQDWSREEIVAAGLPYEIVAKVERLVDRAEYKRRQSPLGARISSRAFGKDRRVPVTNKAVADE